MLRIRLTRTGKTQQESFRIVVAEHTNAVKGKYTELLGHYHPQHQAKTLDLKKERVEYSMSKGAKPSSSLAAILKKHGFANMDAYIELRTVTKTKKKGADGKPAEGAAAKAPAAKAEKAATPAEKPAAEKPAEPAKA